MFANFVYFCTTRGRKNFRGKLLKISRVIRICTKFGNFGGLYRVYKKKLNKPEIAFRLCKAPQCTKFSIEIGCLGTDNAV